MPDAAAAQNQPHSGRPLDSDETQRFDAERARLDAELLADADRLNELDADIRSRKVERVAVRVRFGRNLELRLAITPHGQKGRYVREKARQWGFDWRKAHDNRIYAHLHHHDPEHFSFAQLANLTVLDVRREYQIHLGTDRVSAGRIADRRNAQAIDNTVDMAVLSQARMNQADLRRMLQCQQEGWRHRVYERWTSAFVFRRGTPMSAQERARGLSKLMVDSGAYTASTQGIEINRDEYCDRLLENRWITFFANLDEINHADPDDGAFVSYENFKRMRERGLNPLPVFHAGENITWLRKYIYDEGCTYIALGGVAESRSPNRNWAFFDQCYAVITKSGRDIKTHAFGVADEATLLHFPFASADAASWLLKAQKYAVTDLSRIGDREWRASIYQHHNTDLKYAARTFIEALDANRFERQVRETRDFDFYLVLVPENPWWLPALWTVGHRHALVSNRPGWTPALIKQFIEDPQSILNERRYASKLALLEEMKFRYINNLHAQTRRQRARDEVFGR